MSKKTSKSVTKRIRITKRGKIVRRSMGVDHFKTNRSKKARRQNRRPTSLDYPIRKITNY